MAVDVLMSTSQRDEFQLREGKEVGLKPPRAKDINIGYECLNQIEADRSRLLQALREGVLPQLGAAWAPSRPLRQRTRSRDRNPQRSVW